MPVKKLPDGRNTSDKFDLGRNFATKLWNASRFAMSNLQSAGDRSTAEYSSLADRWIISRFNRAVDEAEKSLAVYRFDQYARTCYDFFWRDFCDWYVEAIKPAMKDPARAAQTADVLAAVLDGALRLMHPMIPFITEAIFQQLNQVRPERGIAGLLECPPSPRLIQAAWPKAGPVDEGAEHVFSRMQGIIGAIRNLRNEHKVDPKRPVSVSIVPPGPEAVAATLDNRELIESLATCHIQSVAANLTPPAGAIRAHVDGCDIYVEGLVDENAERERLAKKRDDLTRQIAAMKGRLANEAYTAKAPPHLVKQTQDQLAAAEAELAKLG
jgi:valyl-tRNA synthetase